MIGARLSTCNTSRLSTSYYHVFQEEAWDGSPEQHAALVRRLRIGRPPLACVLISRARDAFEALDEDKDGALATSADLKRLIEGLELGREPATLGPRMDEFAKLHSGKESPVGSHSGRAVGAPGKASCVARRAVRSLS